MFQGNPLQGDYRKMDKCKQRFVVFQTGAVLERGTAQSVMMMMTLWLINLELYLQFTDEISTIADLIRSERSVIIDHFDKYPTLNGISGVINAMITGAREPEVLKGESNNYWRQVFRLEVDDRVTTGISE